MLFLCYSSGCKNILGANVENLYIKVFRLIIICILKI